MPPAMAGDVQVKNRENVKISPVQSNCPDQSSPTVQSSPVQLSSPVHVLYYAVFSPLLGQNFRKFISATETKYLCWHILIK
jgi:hypothetical protein